MQSQKNFHTPPAPTEGLLKGDQGGIKIKIKFFKGKYEAKLKFPKGLEGVVGGIQTK